MIFEMLRATIVSGLVRLTLLIRLTTTPRSCCDQRLVRGQMSLFIDLFQWRIAI